MRVRRIFKMVHEGNEEAGDEASKREKDCTHNKAGEGQPDKGPVPVKAAVRHLEHPVKPKQRFAPLRFLNITLFGDIVTTVEHKWTIQSLQWQVQNP